MWAKLWEDAHDQALPDGLKSLEKKKKKLQRQALFPDTRVDGVESESEFEPELEDEPETIPEDITSPSSTGGRTTVNRTQRISRSVRSGLVFPVSRLEARLRDGAAGQPSMRIADTTAVFASAVIEFLTVELLELAGDNCRGRKRKRITNQDIFAGATLDEELNQLLKKTIIPSAGTTSHMLQLYATLHILFYYYKNCYYIVYYCHKFPQLINIEANGGAHTA